jgi:hypothetical protein
VTDGLAAAFEQARKAAGNKDIAIVGGADIVRQCLDRGLVEAPRGQGRILRLWTASYLSNLGDGRYLFALSLLALEITRSPSLVSGVTLMLTLAWPVFGLHADSVVDRFDRRNVLLGVSVLRVAGRPGTAVANLLALVPSNNRRIRRLGAEFSWVDPHSDWRSIAHLVPSRRSPCLHQ